MTLDEAGIVALEDLTARAWPAARVAAIGGWRLNAASGFSGRINACWPLEDPGAPVDEAVARTEAWYAAQGLPTLFKINDGACRPEGLARRLEALGYRAHTETLMMMAPLAGQAGDPAVALLADVDAPFAAVFAAAAQGPGDARERLATLARVPAPRVFARLDAGGAAAAVGACAVDGQWAGVFAMRTDAAHRRRGLARRLLLALMGWASAEGASRAWLQVEARNAGAIALYAGAGFAEAYRYSYWSRP
jgi:GNAT superfamily N-acetyltransferase